MTIIKGSALRVLACIFRPGAQRPSYREIAAECGICFARVQQIMNRLQRLGLINREVILARTVMPAFRFIPASKLERQQ